MKRAIAMVLAAVCLFTLAACGNAGNGGAAATEYGRYIEEEVTPPGFEGEIQSITTSPDGLIDILALLATYDEAEQAYKAEYKRYRSEDGGDTWQQLDMGWTQPYMAALTAETPEQYTTLDYSMTPLPGGNILAHTVTYNQNYVQLGSEFIFAATDGTLQTVQFAELEVLKQQGNAIHVTNVLPLAGNRMLLSFIVQEIDENSYGGFSYSSEDILHYVYDLETLQLCYQLKINSQKVFANADTLYVWDAAAGNLQTYSLETGEKISLALPAASSIEGLQNLHESRVAVANSGSIYSLGTKGVTLAGSDGAQTVMAAENYSIGSPLAMAHYFISRGDDGFYIALALDESFKLYRYTWDENALATTGIVLRVFSLYDSATTRQAISEFKKQHPEITVEYSYAFIKDAWEGVVIPEGSGYTSVEDALRVLSTELLAGTGPDILILDDLPTDSYIAQGILEEVSDLAAQTDILAAITEPIRQADGGLYYLPARFAFPMLVGENDDVADLPALVSSIVQNPDALSFAEPDWENASDEELEAYTNEHYGDIPLARRPALAFSSIEETADTLLHATLPSVFPAVSGIDENGLRTYFADVKAISDAFGLTATGETIFISGSMSNGNLEWTTARLLSYYTQEKSRYGYEMLKSLETLEDISTSLFYNRYTWGDAGDGTMRQVEQEGYVHTEAAIRPLGGYAGGVYYPGVMAGIVSTSTQKDAARDFLLCLMSEGVQRYDLADGLATSESGLQQQYESYLATMRRDYADTALEPIEVDLPALTAGLTTPAFENSTIAAAVCAQAVAYCTGQATLEEAVQNVLSETELYFAEKQ